MLLQNQSLLLLRAESVFLPFTYDAVEAVVGLVPTSAHTLAFAQSCRPQVAPVPTPPVRVRQGA